MGLIFFFFFGREAVIERKDRVKNLNFQFNVAVDLKFKILNRSREKERRIKEEN